MKMGDKPVKGDVEAGIADHTDVSAYIETSHHTENTHSHVRTFAVEENQRNTTDNPHREGTSVAPILIRRVNSEELLPRPLKSMSQLVGLSYLTFLCCPLFGALSVNKSWRAKTKRNKGLLSSASDEARSACKCILTTVIFGGILWTIGIVFIVLHATGVMV